MAMGIGIGSENESDTGLTILGALAQLKEEIYQFQNNRNDQNKPPMFFIEGGELELKLVAKRERKADGKLGAKIRMYVFDLDTAASNSQASTREEVQTLKIKFSSLWRPDASTTGSSTSFVIKPTEMTKQEIPPGTPVVQTKTV